MKYRTKPIEIHAHQWDGTPDAFRAIARMSGPTNIRRTSNGEEWKIEVYNYLSKIWLPVHDSEFVILGLLREVYPCDPETFNMKYEIAFPKGGYSGTF